MPVPLVLAAVPVVEWAIGAGLVALGIGAGAGVYQVGKGGADLLVVGGVLYLLVTLGKK